jgi:RNA polymerase sigma factor for flagellar operon FliA
VTAPSLAQRKPDEPSPELVARALPVLRAVASQLSRRLGGRVEADELASLGMPGLLAALRAYEPSRARLEPYVVQRARWAMLDALRRETHHRAGAQARALCVAERRAHDRELGGEPGGPPTWSTLGERLAGELGEHAMCLVLGIASHEAPDPEASSLDRERAERLRHLVKALPAREREVIERFYFGDEPLERVAAALGISKSRASRLHTRALGALRDHAGDVR